MSGSEWMGTGASHELSTDGMQEDRISRPQTELGFCTVASKYFPPEDRCIYIQFPNIRGENRNWMGKVGVSPEIGIRKEKRKNKREGRPKALHQGEITLSTFFQLNEFPRFPRVKKEPDFVCLLHIICASSLTISLFQNLPRMQIAQLLVGNTNGFASRFENTKNFISIYEEVKRF